MVGRRKFQLLSALFLGTVMAGGGCLGGPAPTDQFYQLELPEPPRKFDTPPLKGTLQVTRPEANALTGERPLLYRQKSESPQIHRYAYHRWVDSPTIMIQQELTRYLRASRLAKQVVTPKFRVKVDYVLSCQILKLERIVRDSPSVLLELELGITSIQDNQTLLLQTYREEQSVNGEGIDASVLAYNEALSKILSRFLADSAMIDGSGRVTNSR